MPIRLRLFGLGLVWLMGACAVTTPSPSPLPIQCSATGAKFMTPPMSAEAICARFVAALHDAAPGASGNGLTVELSFLPQGVAIAGVTRAPDEKQRFERAVSDRKFQPSDIDGLAADVATAMLHPPMTRRADRPDARG